MFVITATGLSGERKQWCRAAVLTLRGTWSGPLVVGPSGPSRTTHLVVGTRHADPAGSDKVRVALAAGVPLVSTDWLEHSLEQGFFLAHESYTVDVISCAPAQLTPLESTSQVPSPERLRAMPAGDQAAEQPVGFLQELQRASPLRADTCTAMQEQRRLQPGSPHVALTRDVIDDLLLSPAAQCTCTFPGLSPLQLQRLELASPAVPAESALEATQRCSSGRLTALLPSCKVQQQHQQPPEKHLAAAQDFLHQQREEAVNCSPRPTAAAAPSGEENTPQSSSDAKVARFLSRACLTNAITLKRGGSLWRRRSASPDRSSSPAALAWGARGQHRLQEAGVPSRQAQQPCDQPEKQGIGTEVLQFGQAAAAAVMSVPHAAMSPMDMQPASPAAAPMHSELASRAATTGTAASPQQASAAEEGGRPSMAAIPRRLRWSGASTLHLPTSTVERGTELPAHHRPSPQTLQGIVADHGLENAAGVKFYAWARCTPPGGRALTFEAGDPCHGARMLFDVLPGGQREMARCLLLSIYSLPDGGGMWMEHKYLFEKADLLQRQAWAASLHAAGGEAIGEDELLLSVGRYHSPLDLIVGQFGLAFRPVGRSTANGRLPISHKPVFPLFECRWAFDTEKAGLVPLHYGLEGLRGC